MTSRRILIELLPDIDDRLNSLASQDGLNKTTIINQIASIYLEILDAAIDVVPGALQKLRITLPSGDAVVIYVESVVDSDGKHIRNELEITALNTPVNKLKALIRRCINWLTT